MQKYDLIFFGKSSFTEDLYTYFSKHVKTILLDNDSINYPFSTTFFTPFCFIPQNTETENFLGYIADNSMRFEINTTPSITQIFIDEIFQNNMLFNDLLIKASQQINLLNEIIIESNGKFSLSLLLRNLKTSNDIKIFFETIKKQVYNKSFDEFLSLFEKFFAPGEVNTYLYRKYLFFSLLTKKTYEINNIKTILNTNKSNSSLLTEIKATEEGWILNFTDKSIEGKFLISTITPHILNFAHIKHPFKVDYDKIFYEVKFTELLEIPSSFPTLLLYKDTITHYYFFKANKNLSVFIEANLENKPNKDSLEKSLKNIFPHLEVLPNYELIPHIFIANKNVRKRKLILNKNYFFTKNYEFPFLGTDGEVLYRNILKEFLWKKLL
jgi:hypothetical protein